MSFFLARRRVFSGLKGVKVVQMVIPSRWNSCDVSERHSMQEHLNEFMRWAAKWQLQIAEHKCCGLSHGNVTQPMYYMHTVQLPNVNECRDFGVFIDSHCNCMQHSSHICRKA